jgi:predicted RNA methylase
VLDVDAVQPALRKAANLVRTQLLSNQATPTIFRPMLDEIPPRERDGWVDLLWDLDEIPDDDPELPRGCVPYLPCPVATVLEAVQQARVTDDDVFVDVGSGTGRTAFLASLLTGAGCIGLEIQPALVHAARGRAAWLNLDRIRFVQGDAAEQLRFITIGTVFFFNCPFGADRVRRVLDDLEAIARTRPIRICCVHMPPLERPWLVRVPSTSVDLDVYRSSNSKAFADWRAVLSRMK